jgi:hypothetical protein
MPSHLIYEVGYAADGLSFLACSALLLLYVKLPNEAKQGLPSCMLNLTIADMLCAISMLINTPIPKVDEQYSTEPQKRCKWAFFLFLGMLQCTWFFTLTISLHAQGALMIYLNRRVPSRREQLGDWIVRHQLLGWIIPLVMPAVLLVTDWTSTSTVYTFQNLDFCEPSNNTHIHRLCLGWTILVTIQIMAALTVHLKTWKLAQKSSTPNIQELLFFSKAFTAVYIATVSPTIYLAAFFWSEGQFPRATVGVQIWCYACIPLSGFMNTSIYVCTNKLIRAEAALMWYGGYDDEPRPSEGIPGQLRSIRVDYDDYDDYDDEDDEDESVVGFDEMEDLAGQPGQGRHSRQSSFQSSRKSSGLHDSWGRGRGASRGAASRPRSEDRPDAAPSKQAWGKYVYDEATNSYFRPSEEARGAAEGEDPDY